MYFEYINVLDFKVFFTENNTLTTEINNQRILQYIIVLQLKHV